MTSSQKELVEKLKGVKIDASKLRNELNTLDAQKESWFKKKEEFSAKIRDFIKKIKENKSKRDSLNSEVKALKPKRNEVNIKIAEKLKDIDKLRKEKAELVSSIHIKESPSRIKQVIEKLEFRIETDTASFEKEKGLMKKIKQLKKLYEDASIVFESNKKVRDASDNIRMVRREANELHRIIQEKAGQSQILHEEILRVSTEIDKLRVDEDDAFKKFSELKKQFNESNFKLKEKLKEMNEIKGGMDKIDNARREKRKQDQQSFLKLKEEEVNQKIKRREKLTTEDLLAFQQFGNR
ncbi:MAG: hypothetical protein AABX33_01290 [Nanoarchaeota archaeon]